LGINGGAKKDRWIFDDLVFVEVSVDDVTINLGISPTIIAGIEHAR
jgi:hypothetical protein